MMFLQSSGLHYGRVGYNIASIFLMFTFHSKIRRLFLLPCILYEEIKLALMENPSEIPTVYLVAYIDPCRCIALSFFDVHFPNIVTFVICFYYHL